MCLISRMSYFGGMHFHGSDKSRNEWVPYNLKSTAGLAFSDSDAGVRWIYYVWSSLGVSFGEVID